MGFIAALKSKTGEDVSRYIQLMLSVASPLSGDGYGVGTPEESAFSHRLIEDLSNSETMLGYKLIKTMPYDQPQPFTQYGYSMIFEGRLRCSTAPSHISAAADIVGPDLIRGLRKLVHAEKGSYVIAAAHNGEIFCGRDPVGSVPLYIGQSGSLAGAASNRKMLWSLGIEAETLTPGSLAEISKSGIRLHKVSGLRMPSPTTRSKEEMVEKLDFLFSETVNAYSRGLFRASLGFSGGIDSSLLAYYLDKSGVDVDLICVGVEGSKDFEAAEEAAESLSLPFRLESFPKERVEEDLESVLLSVEEANPVKVGIALPLYWTARSATENGSNILFSGNGSDELFGGYHKYLRTYATSGEAASKMMFKDVVKAYEDNYERDHKICADLGVEIKFPFADREIVDFGLALPIELKLSPDESAPRKLLLRSLGKKIGLPDEVAFRRKRAIQYSTGVDRILKKLAKKQSQKLSRFLADNFFRLKEKNFDISKLI